MAGVWMQSRAGTFSRNRSTPEAMNSPLAAPPTNPMARGGDFPELDWMQPSHLTWEEEIEGLKYAIYKMKKTEQSETKADPTSPVRGGWPPRPVDHRRAGSLIAKSAKPSCKAHLAWIIKEKPPI